VAVVLKLDPALFLDRCLFDRDHLAFHLPQFSGRLLASADEKCSRPEDDTAAAVASPSLVR
jgi:hypothetical protein